MYAKRTVLIPSPPTSPIFFAKKAGDTERSVLKTLEVSSCDLHNVLFPLYNGMFSTRYFAPKWRVTISKTLSGQAKKRKRTLCKKNLQHATSLAALLHAGDLYGRNLTMQDGNWKAPTFFKQPVLAESRHRWTSTVKPRSCSPLTLLINIWK